MRVYYNYEDDSEVMEPRHAFSREGKLLDRSTVEDLAITFVFIHCTLHAACSMEGHEAELSV